MLLLFFFSYAGPLSKTELEIAYNNGFVRPIGSGRLSHMRSWPKQYADWADGDPRIIAYSKAFYVGNPDGPGDLLDSTELRDCLRDNWPEDLRQPIRSLLQLTFTTFVSSMKGGHPEVSHAQFITALDEWLVTYSALEHESSNCPNITQVGLEFFFQLVSLRLILFPFVPLGISDRMIVLGTLYRLTDSPNVSLHIVLPSYQPWIKQGKERKMR